jgi:hypothetical protein
MAAKKEEPHRHCPRCNGPTEQTVECCLCGKVGCLERCNKAGKNAPCESCASAAADDARPLFDEPEERERSEEE